MAKLGSKKTKKSYSYNRGVYAKGSPQQKLGTRAYKTRPKTARSDNSYTSFITGLNPFTAPFLNQAIGDLTPSQQASLNEYSGSILPQQAKEVADTISNVNEFVQGLNKALQDLFRPESLINLIGLVVGIAMVLIALRGIVFSEGQKIVTQVLPPTPKVFKGRGKGKK